MEKNEKKREMEAAHDKIVVDHLSYTYQGAESQALGDVSMRVHAGEFLAVLGHNGSGKSCLLYTSFRTMPHRCGASGAILKVSLCKTADRIKSRKKKARAGSSQKVKKFTRRKRRVWIR